MSRSGPYPSVVTTAIAIGALCAGANLAEAATYVQTDLVSDIPGLAAIPDSNLENPWGVSFFGGSPFWISNQLTNTATLYAVTGGTNVSTIPLVVAIPTTGGGPPQGPTGQVANTNSSSFDVGHGGNDAAAHFIFANLNGTISAWNSGPTAFIQVAPTTTPAIYTGLAINQGDTRLYAANAVTGGIDVFNSSFGQVNLGSGAFSDPAISGLVPFNVQDIGGHVYVTYAPAGRPAQIGATPGEGAVAIFNEDGVLQQTLINGLSDHLAAPWGVALAPASFGQFGGDLLVGNFSYLHSEINAFDPTTGAFLGTIPIDPGAAMGENPGGLWTLTFGVGGSNGSPDVLYFTDGINGEADGLFGAIASVPEPSTWAMMLVGLAGLGLAGRKKTRKNRLTPAIA